MYQILGFIKRSTRGFTDKHNSLICSRLDYCSQVWSPSGTRMITEIERVQKKHLILLGTRRKLFIITMNTFLCVKYLIQRLWSQEDIALMLWKICFVIKWKNLKPIQDDSLYSFWKLKLIYGLLKDELSIWKEKLNFSLVISTHFNCILQDIQIIFILSLYVVRLWLVSGQARASVHQVYTGTPYQWWVHDPR